MLKRSAALLAALAVLLVGCSQVEQGTVVKKDYSPARSSCTNGNCTSYSESFELRLKNSRDEGWREVTEREYEKYEIGDQYP